MGSLLKCPLCCGQEFASRFLLKSHILNIIDHMICPSCNSKFDSVLDLAQHLSKECKKTKNTFKKESTGKETQAKVSEYEFIGVPKYEIEETESTTYFCQMCDVHIDSVDEHLEKYHQDEEVIVVSFFIVIQ